MRKGIRFFATFFAIALVFTVVACGKKPDEGTSEPTYTDEENYAMFRAGVVDSLSCDDGYTYFETTGYVVDGVILEIDKSYETRDGNRFMYEYTERTADSESPEAELVLTKHLTKAVKLVTVDGEQKYKDCLKQLRGDGKYERSGNYVAAEDLGNYVSTEHSPKTVLSAVLTADDAYADFVARLKKYIVENESDRGVTADKITVLIGRDSIDTSRITVSATAEGISYEEGGKQCTGKLIWTFVVKDGKVTECGHRSEITTDKGNGTTGSTTISVDATFRYEFDEERYGEIVESEYTVTE